MSQMADSGAVRELRTKPVTMRSVFARETIGLFTEKLIDSGVQERDPQTNELLIVAKVFGSVEPIQKTKIPPKDVEDFHPAVHLLCGIVRDNKTDDQIINGTIIGWTERHSKSRLAFNVLLDFNQSETNDSSVNTLYTDSIFPVVMGVGFKPLDKLPDGYGYAIYLYLFGMNIQPIQRKVRFVSNNQEVDCQTFRANLYILAKISDKIGYKDNCIAIKRILDVNNPSYDVIGLYAPVIARAITGTPARVGRDISNSSIRYSIRCFADRTTYLVANDGLLCVVERVENEIKKWMVSLLKSDTYCISEGCSTTMSYKKLSSLHQYFPFVPYSELIVIVGEGVNQLTIERIAEKVVPNYSFVVSTLRLQDLTDNVVCMEARQLSADLQSTTESPLQSSQLSLRPLMKLSDIGDHFVLQYYDRKKFIGDYVFSLNTFYYTNRQYGDSWNLFVCLNDNTTDPMDRDCQYCSTVVARYAIYQDFSGQQQQQLDLPEIDTYDRNPYVPIEVLSPDIRHRWTNDGRQKILPWKNRDEIRFHVHLMEGVKILQFSNIGVNLIRRFLVHQKQRFRFPTKQMNQQFVESNKKQRQ